MIEQNKITLFNLRKSSTKDVKVFIENEFKKSVHTVDLSENAIKACTGCWSCWLKTPGMCVFNDPMAQSYPHYVNSEMIVIAIDTAQGFINHVAKAFFDRSIVHFHPYIELVSNECHHVARYQRYPKMVFYYDYNSLTSTQNKIIEDYLFRVAFHFKSEPYRIIKNDNFKIERLEPRKASNKKSGFDQTSPMDKLIIYNGSPRVSKSNSQIILNEVEIKLKDKVEIRDLKNRAMFDVWANQFDKEEHVMFFMPLYVHAMPSHVMEFIEKLKPSKGDISFFVQSGFPESSQSHYLEAYFEELSVLLNRKYLGTCIKGGMEGLQQRPENMQLKMIQPLVDAIEHVVNVGHFHFQQVDSLAKPVVFSKTTQVLFNLVGKKMMNYFWDSQLKQNNALSNSFDQPYVVSDNSSDS